MRSTPLSPLGQGRRRERMPTETTRPDGRTGREVFRATTHAVEAWAGQETVPSSCVPVHVGAHVESSLNDVVEDVWEREVVERPSDTTAADIVVNGTVGVVVVTDFPADCLAVAGQYLDDYVAQYRYLVVYAHELSEREATRLRTAEQRYLDAELDLRGFEVVSRASPSSGNGCERNDRSQSSGRPTGVAAGLGVAAAAAAVVAGLAGGRIEPAVALAAGANAAAIAVWAVVTGGGSATE